MTVKEMCQEKAFKRIRDGEDNHLLISSALPYFKKIHKLSNKQVAVMLGVSMQTVTDWINTRHCPSQVYVYKIFKLLRA